MKLVPKARAETIPSDDEGLSIGQWYWLNDKEDGKTLVCITHLGSNYAELQGVNKYSSWRVHFDHFAKECERCWDPDVVIETKVVHHKAKLAELMGEVQRIMGSLVGKGESTALVLHETRDLGKLKTALVKAKEDLLPALFEDIENTSKNLGRWMGAKAIPLRGQAGELRKHIEAIDEQIFSVELYTGLVEHVVQIAKGKPAPATEKLHLFQRLHYMDEECLLDYQAGGMRFEKLEKFDQWLKLKRNRDRILPFPRCMVAFRVRRELDRVWLGMISMFQRDPDEKTFLYIRNGTNLYRLSTGIEFGETLFPDMERSEFGDEKLYARDIDNWAVIPQRRYEELKENYAAWKKRHKKLPKEDRWRDDREDDPEYYYKPFDPTNLYYDDITEALNKQAKHYNKIALILQGLYDRSVVLHPHPPVKLWEDLQQHVKPIYDNDRSLPPPNKPDFEAYRARLNASIKVGSVTVGQQWAWMRAEAEKLSYRDQRYEGYPTLHKPYGNPGPGKLAAVTKVSRNKTKVSFRWKRERQREPSWRSKNQSPFVQCHFTCKTTDVLNVSAYTPGDFKQFFNDPRTRVEYLKWAPLLLAAEDYYAGEAKVGSDPND